MPRHLFGKNRYTWICFIFRIKCVFRSSGCHHLIRDSSLLTRWQFSNEVNIITICYWNVCCVWRKKSSEFFVENRLVDQQESKAYKLHVYKFLWKMAYIKKDIFFKPVNLSWKIMRFKKYTTLKVQFHKFDFIHTCNAWQRLWDTWWMSDIVPYTYSWDEKNWKA